MVSNKSHFFCSFQFLDVSSLFLTFSPSIFSHSFFIWSTFYFFLYSSLVFFLFILILFHTHFIFFSLLLCSFYFYFLFADFFPIFYLVHFIFFSSINYNYLKIKYILMKSLKKLFRNFKKHEVCEYVNIYWKNIIFPKFILNFNFYLKQVI